MHRTDRVPAAVPLTMFLIGALIGILVAYDPAPGIPWFAALIVGAALYIGIALWARTPERLRLVAMAPVIYAAWSALLLATQYRHLGFDVKFAPATMLGNLSSMIFPAFWPPIIDRNAIAMTMEGSLPLAFALGMRAHGRERWIWFGTALLIGFSVFLTASRGAYVALAIGALLYALLEWRRRRAGAAQQRWLTPRTRYALLAGVILLPILIAGLLLATPQGAIALDAAISRAFDRLSLYRNSFFLALDFAFTGSGSAGSFPLVYSAYQLLISVPYLGYPHNLPLGIWLSQGLLGLVGFAALALAGGRLIVRGLLAGVEDGAQEIRQGAAVGCAALLIHGLSDAPQYDPIRIQIPVMCFLLFAVAVAGARLADDRPLQWIRLSRERAIALAGTAVVALALTGPQLASLVAVNISALDDAHAVLAENADASERAASYAESVVWMNRAVQLMPASDEALKRRGMLAYRAGDYDAVIRSLEPVFAHRPADEAVRKALGYAYIWNGRIGEGAMMLARLERAAEARQELGTWAFVWTERGRVDLAERAREAERILSDSD